MIKKKYVDGAEDLRAGKAMSEFHCSRTWFPEEKPIRFKKTNRTALPVGGVAWSKSNSFNSTAADSVKIEEDAAVMSSLMNEPVQKAAKHASHLLK